LLSTAITLLEGVLKKRIMLYIYDFTIYDFTILRLKFLQEKLFSFSVAQR